MVDSKSIFFNCSVMPGKNSSPDTMQCVMKCNQAFSHGFQDESPSAKQLRIQRWALQFIPWQERDTAGGTVTPEQGHGPQEENVISLAFSFLVCNWGRCWPRRWWWGWYPCHWTDVKKTCLVQKYTLYGSEVQ